LKIASEWLLREMPEFRKQEAEVRVCCSIILAPDILELAVFALLACKSNYKARKYFCHRGTEALTEGARIEGVRGHSLG
jgi:hypothetical protein